MDTAVYGVVSNDAHVDVSLSLHGAKCYATINGYQTVSKRIGYNSIVVAHKYNGKWDMYPLPF